MSKPSSEEKPSNVASFLAAATFATAFGNMFAARRLRVPKAPRGFYKEGASNSSSSSTSSSTHARAGTGGDKYRTENPDARARQRHRDYHYAKEQQRVMREAYGHMGRRRRGPGALSIPTSVQLHLQALSMSVDELPTRQEVAQAYRSLAMEHHPDRLSADSPTRLESEKTFKAAAHAYKQLNIWFDIYDREG